MYEQSADLNTLKLYAQVEKTLEILTLVNQVLTKKFTLYYYVTLQRRCKLRIEDDGTIRFKYLSNFGLNEISNKVLTINIPMPRSVVVNSPYSLQS